MAALSFLLFFPVYSPVMSLACLFAPQCTNTLQKKVIPFLSSFFFLSRHKAKILHLTVKVIFYQAFTYILEVNAAQKLLR